MKVQGIVFCLLGLCSPVSSDDVHGVPARILEIGLDTRRPVVSFLALRITNRAVEIRCEIRNDTADDIWVCSTMPGIYHVDATRGTNARVFPDADDDTLVILRRMDSPRGGVWGEKVAAAYDVLPPQQSRQERLLVVLPITYRPSHHVAFSRMMDTGVKELTRLAFEIGYYTDGDLRLLSARDDDERIRFDASGERVVLVDYVETGIWTRERAIRTTVDGIHIPLRQWLGREKIIGYTPPRELLQDLRGVFLGNSNELPESELWYAQELLRFDPSLYDDIMRQVADTYIALAEGTFDPNELVSRLNGILMSHDRQKLLDELRRRESLASVPNSSELTPVQKLQDLFFNFSLNLEQYRYARELLSIDSDLLTRAAERMVDAYVDVAEGRLNPAELPRRLDAILSRSDREGLLEKLLERQAEE